jgi:sporadic carbohydrate cluster protein (TIGR04323 family)
MTIASVTTDINIGPYKIPSNAQNMIMNNYALRAKLQVELVIPEPIMSDELATTQWLNREFKFSHLIFCSYHQLPLNKNHFDKALKNLSNVNFHFVIEGLNGEGIDFMNKCYEESVYFKGAKIIESKKTNWIELYDIFKKNL